MFRFLDRLALRLLVARLPFLRLGIDPNEVEVSGLVVVILVATGKLRLALSLVK